MGYRFIRLTGLFLLAFAVSNSSACEGNKMKVHYIKNCGDDSAKNIIRIPANSTIELTSDCFFVPHSCLETDGFKTASVVVQIWKNNLPVLRKEADLCEKMSKMGPEVKTILSMYGLPTVCPVEKIRTCDSGTKKIQVMEKFKNFLQLGRGGPIKIEVKITHDNGETCVHLELEVDKPDFLNMIPKI